MAEFIHLYHFLILMSE